MTSLAFHHGVDFPDCDGSERCKLSERKFEKEEGDSDDGEHDEVWDEEGTCNNNNKSTATTTTNSTHKPPPFL